MGFKFWDFFRTKSGKATYKELTLSALTSSSVDYWARELSYMSCVNLIGNALGRCEVRTFVEGRETRDGEYFLWNVEPNGNQSSTAFWHKVAHRLFSDNEALIIPTNKRGGGEGLCCADSFDEPRLYPSKQTEYTGVRVGEVLYDKTFREHEVLHLQLNHVNIRPVLNGMYESFCRMLNAAINAYEWENGQHWKVHVDQIASGQDGFSDNFTQMIREQVKPFFDTGGTVLPEFDGYKYERIGEGAKTTTDQMRALVNDIYRLTAKSLNMPFVLVDGEIAGIDERNKQFMSLTLDPICDQIAEEITRKRYGFENWKKGNRVIMDSSSIQHFDIFEQSASVEKAISAGAFTINDIRRSANQPEIDEDWANESFMTKNFAATEDLKTESGEGSEA